MSQNVDIRDRERGRSLLDASEEVTRLWKGPSAVEEIRSQREKTW